MKRFKVVAESKIMDAEFNCESLDIAIGMFFALKSKGMYTKVYVMDNETGEFYRTYDKKAIGGGIAVAEWFSIGGDL